MRYVIIAPTYNQKTAGIAVLQELQKWLIKSGKDAIIPNININAPYAIQDDDIVVYPEIIPGNPLNAKRVVRYILNVPGKLGGTTEYDSREILVAYTKEFSRYSNGIYLEIPIIEDFFTHRGLERTVDCFWVGKGRNTHHPFPVHDPIPDQHLIAEPLQGPGHDGGSAKLRPGGFRMLVEVPPPGDRLLLQSVRGLNDLAVHGWPPVARRRSVEELLARATGGRY